MYELHGIIDVVTDIELGVAPETNFLKNAIQMALPRLTGRYEVIIDYKGSRRPAINHDYWTQGDWQVQTYAWLRTRQPRSLPVAAGVLLYINELSMSGDDLAELKREIVRGGTDVVPTRGSPDYYNINAWRSGSAVPAFSLEFRLARAIRVIGINSSSQRNATGEFDRVVREIETCVSSEAAAGNIMTHWMPRGDDDTCAACDFRHFCPNPAPRSSSYVVTAPDAP
jgi:CRISPR/Cas system-associated exonuclease Cas4 (RecB family)